MCGIDLRRSPLVIEAGTVAEGEDGGQVGGEGNWPPSDGKDYLPTYLNLSIWGRRYSEN